MLGAVFKQHDARVQWSNPNRCVGWNVGGGILIGVKNGTERVRDEMATVQWPTQRAQGFVSGGQCGTHTTIRGQHGLARQSSQNWHQTGTRGNQKTKKSAGVNRLTSCFLAPRPGLEPGTYGLTVPGSAISGITRDPVAQSVSSPCSVMPVPGTAWPAAARSSESIARGRGCPPLRWRSSHPSLPTSLPP